MAPTTFQREVLLIVMLYSGRVCVDIHSSAVLCCQGATHLRRLCVRLGSFSCSLPLCLSSANLNTIQHKIALNASVGARSLFACRLQIRHHATHNCTQCFSGCKTLKLVAKRAALATYMFYCQKPTPAPRGLNKTHQACISYIAAFFVLMRARRAARAALVAAIIPCQKSVLSEKQVHPCERLIGGVVGRHGGGKTGADDVGLQ